MSSFEPLFARPGRTRLTPPVVVPVGAAGAWMPQHVGDNTPRTPSVFEMDFDDVDGRAAAIADDAAIRAATDAATALARQAELDEAYLRGVSEGREQGEQAERARLRGAMMAAESALDDLRAGEARWLANIEENIAAIAVAIAQQVIARDVATTNDIVLEVVTRAVQEFGLDQALSIRVNPGDLESLQSAERTATEEMNAITKGREVRWLADARIEPGGCVVEGRERIVDGRVDTALERLYRRLTYTNA
jgi:flagellar biosynthesis/type III secretory pathway protein FliH